MDLEAGFWARDYEADQQDSEIVPKPDEKRLVYVPLSSELGNGEKFYVFWFPPYSEFNGWDDNPDEIRGTHVVECTLTYLESYPFKDEQINSFVEKWIIPKTASKYEASVLKVTPFLEFCKNYRGNDDFFFQQCGYSGGRSKIIWQESREYRKALFSNNLIYLTGNVAEQSFGALIEVSIGGRYYVKYHEHFAPSLEECVAINYELKGTELLFFKKTIDNAIELK